MSSVMIGQHPVELRFTLLTLKRVRAATGKSLSEFLGALAAGKLSEEEVVPTMLWAMVGHHPVLGQWTEDQIAGAVDAAAMAEVCEHVVRASTEAAPDPPAEARAEAAEPLAP